MKRTCRHDFVFETGEVAQVQGHQLLADKIGRSCELLVRESELRDERMELLRKEGVAGFVSGHIAGT